jgi:TRAP-type C4-dicarboxylate transport system permease small subunit
MHAFRKMLAAIGVVELHIAVVAFAFVVGLTIVQVAYRYLLAGSIWWAQEVAQLAMLIAYFFGIAYVYKIKQDVIITFMVRKLSRSAQVALGILAQALIAAFCLIIVATAVELAPSQLVFNTYILGIPRFYSTLPLLVASVSMAATAIYYGLLTWQTRSTQPESGLLYENDPDHLIIGVE